MEILKIFKEHHVEILQDAPDGQAIEEIAENNGHQDILQFLQSERLENTNNMQL